MQKGTVLLLEDSRAQALVVSRMIEKLGWSCVLSFDLNMAFAAIKCSNPDLLLFDVYLEAGNTLLELPKIRQLAPNIPLAIMSAGGENRNAKNNTLNQARIAQVDFVLAKPFGINELSVVLDETYKLNRMQDKIPHILVIDDSHTVRKITSAALAQNNYQISVAVTFEEAIERGELGDVDLVITDIFMPGMGGIEGIAFLKKNWPHIAVIAMSAGIENQVAHEQVLSAALHIGATAQIAKPFSADQINDLVKSVFEGLRHAA